MVQLSDANAEVFLARLTRLDRQALVRLRPSEPGHVTIYAMLPWGTLVCRDVESDEPQDLHGAR